MGNLGKFISIRLYLSQFGRSKPVLMRSSYVCRLPQYSKLYPDLMNESARIVELNEKLLGSARAEFKLWI